MNLLELSDNQLINNYWNGDEKALEVLFARYLRIVHSVVYRYINNSTDVEDIIQEVFIKIWKNLKKFNQEKSFKTWILQIVKNTAIDWLRHKSKQPFLALENEEGELLVDTLADTAELPNIILEKAGDRNDLLELINQLPLNDRLVLFLHYTEELTFEEMADINKESVNTLKSRHRRALIKLKKLLDAPKNQFNS